MDGVSHKDHILITGNFTAIITNNSHSSRTPYTRLAWTLYRTWQFPPIIGLIFRAKWTTWCTHMASQPSSVQPTYHAQPTYRRWVGKTSYASLAPEPACKVKTSYVTHFKYFVIHVQWPMIHLEVLVQWRNANFLLCPIPMAMRMLMMNEPE